MDGNGSLLDGRRISVRMCKPSEKPRNAGVRWHRDDALKKKESMLHEQVTNGGIRRGRGDGASAGGLARYPRGVPLDGCWREAAGVSANLKTFVPRPPLADRASSRCSTHRVVRHLSCAQLPLPRKPPHEMLNLRSKPPAVSIPLFASRSGGSSKRTSGANETGLGGRRKRRARKCESARHGRGRRGIRRGQRGTRSATRSGRRNEVATATAMAVVRDVRGGGGRGAGVGAGVVTATATATAAGVGIVVAATRVRAGGETINVCSYPTIP